MTDPKPLHAAVHAWRLMNADDMHHLESVAAELRACRATYDERVSAALRGGLGDFGTRRMERAAGELADAEGAAVAALLLAFPEAR